MYASLLVLVCLGLANSHLIQKRFVIDRGDYIETCEQEPMEVGIVLDSSRSINSADFGKTLKFLHDFLDYFQIGDGHDDVRVSLIPFGRGIYPEAGFDLDTYSNKQGVLDAVMNIEHKNGDRTDTGDAVEYMYLHQLNAAKTRSWAEKISIVVTDGNSQLRDRTKAMSANARATNISMYAIGIGNVQRTELLNIAGVDDHVTQVESFDKLDAVKEILAKKTCTQKKKTTTTTMTPVPMTQPCGIEDPADINFIFSPADLGVDNTAWATSFSSAVLDQGDMIEGFRYGAITGDCPTDAGFALDRYNNVDAIRERLMGYDGIKLPRLVQQAATGGFSVGNGARPDSRKVAVLVASGEKGEAEIHRAVTALTEQGVQVFIANPTGSSINIAGAMVLQGGGTFEQAQDLVSLLCPM